MSFNNVQRVVATATGGAVVAIAILSITGQSANAKMMAVTDAPSAPEILSAKDNASLRNLAGQFGTSKVDGLEPAIEANVLNSVRSLYAEGELKTGQDYLSAANLLSRSSNLKDRLMAHDMAETALALGHANGFHWIAITEDRIELASGRGQRFGTQYVLKNGKPELAKMDGAITDQHRNTLRLPTVADLKSGDVVRVRSKPPQVMKLTSAI